MGRYNDFMMMQAEKPELSKLLRDQLQTQNMETTISPEDITVIANLLIAYGIVEEAFLLHAKKWIDEDTWRQWAAWLKDLTKHPWFQLVHRWMNGQFDKRFQNYVSKVMEEK
jgi:hypothetical protein